MSDKYTPTEQKKLRGVAKLLMILLVISAGIAIIVLASGGGILGFLITFAVLSFMSMGVAGIATIFTSDG